MSKFQLSTILIVFLFITLGARAFPNVVNVPNSLCLDKLGCRCRFTLNEDYMADNCLYGDACLYATVGTTCKRRANVIPCSAAGECYCGAFAEFKTGNQYCIRTSTKNYYVDEIPEKLKDKAIIANQEYFNDAITNFATYFGEIYGRAMNDKDLPAYGSETYYPTSVSIPDEKRILAQVGAIPII